jgi:hypothetical protein
MQLLTQLNDVDKKQWKLDIQKYRKRLIDSPDAFVQKVIEQKKMVFSPEAISEYLISCRSACWEYYLEQELHFHKEMLSILLKENAYASTILAGAIQEHLNETASPATETLASVVGQTAGYLTPYIYELCLSSTNSRRSRSGKTFEKLVEHIITTCYKYPFSTQSMLGSHFYTKNDLGKMVDGIIPSAEAFEANRSQCVFITMKTSLRERWQEVAEEQNRTNIPTVYLLTMDTTFSEENIRRMNHSNINLVVSSDIKEKYHSFSSICSYETFFNRTIPRYLAFWQEGES